LHFDTSGQQVLWHLLEHQVLGTKYSFQAATLCDCRAAQYIEMLRSFVYTLCALLALSRVCNAFVGSFCLYSANPNSRTTATRCTRGLQASLDVGVVEQVMQVYNTEHVDQLVRLAAAFSSVVTNLQDVRMAHITKVTPEGDGVELEVMYCDEEDNRCVL
jgi:hypothetical protein